MSRAGTPAADARECVDDAWTMHGHRSRALIGAPACPGSEAIFETVHFVADRAAADGAAELIALFGDDAAYEAARRAEASRRVGNHIHFTRWRRVERMIGQLDPATPIETLH